MFNFGADDRTAPYLSNIRAGDRPGETIIDTENWAEQLATGIAGMGFVTLFILLVAWIFNAFSNTKFLNELGIDSLQLFVWGSLLAALGAFLRSKVDYYLIVNPEDRTIQTYHRYSDREWRTDLCSFSDIAGLAIDGKRVKETERRTNRPNRSYYAWYYGLVLVLQSGKTIRLIGQHTTEFEEIRDEAQSLARELETRLHCEENKVLWLKRGAQGVEFLFADRGKGELAASAGCLAGLAVFLLYLGYRTLTS